ncbi:uncharacterized protein LOC122028890 isoform X8 [Zingiber officinale]|uniref:uncharacterized protein LOC122028890 isoform X8 n=1 Tax=Zingiber officinale TaxID=94328 RepID=UPI001C4AF179|nr:uncharacterized protein LOC122028890 isoform X8 [Zingiber officinale]
MSSFTGTRAGDGDSPDLVCQLDCVQGMVDALSSVRWKRHQDAVVEISEHGLVLIVEESGCLQARVYLKRELFLAYEYAAEGRPRFGVSLGLFVDCLNIFSTPGHSPVIEIRYPGLDMQLLLKLHRSVDTPDAYIYAEIRTRIPDTIAWDYNFEPIGSVPVSFTVKEAVDDLEWPCSSIQISLQPDPPAVTFRGEGHGDLQVSTFLSGSPLTMPITSQCTFRRRYTQIQVQISPSSDIKHSKQCVEGQQRKQSDCREGRDAEDTTLGIGETIVGPTFLW